jgi:enoyl-CoA hydratase/carnithine racemase
MSGEAPARAALVAIDRPRPGIIRLELRRPERLNALSSELIVAVHAALDDCRVVVLTGGGRGFCAGMDLRDFGQPPGPVGRDEIQRSLAVQR